MPPTRPPEKLCPGWKERDPLIGAGKGSDVHACGTGRGFEIKLVQWRYRVLDNTDIYRYVSK